MNNYTSPAQLFDEAVRNFQYPIRILEWKERDFQYSIYTEDYTFRAGHLMDYPVEANGRIQYSKEGEQVKIEALFWLTVQVGWYTHHRLATSHIYGEYHIERKSWNLVFNSTAAKTYTDESQLKRLGANLNPK